MKRHLKRVVVGAIIVSIAISAIVFVKLRTFHVEKISEDLFILRGMGGNIAILNTSAGAVVVDSMFLPMQGRLISEKARELTGKTPALIINTHYHPDHSRGNPGVAGGPAIFSSIKAHQRMLEKDASFWRREGYAHLPQELVVDRRQISIGDKRLTLLPIGPAHTDGDLVVIFHDENAIHLGDLVFHNLYPLIDFDVGGSYVQWIKTLDLILEESFQVAIPGHGETTNWAGVQEFQDFLRHALAAAFELKNHQAGRDAFIEGYSSPSSNLRSLIPFLPISIERNYFLKSIWQEVTSLDTLDLTPGLD